MCKDEATTWRIWASAPPASDIATYQYNSSARFLCAVWAALFSEIILFFLVIIVTELLCYSVSVFTVPHSTSVPLHLLIILSHVPQTGWQA